jgi:F-type H+-transporting ATPase subunit b
MVNLDYTIWIQMFNFLFLIFLLNIFLYKSILKIMGKRNQQLQDSDEEVKKLNQTIEEKMAAYEEKVRQARLEAIVQKNEIEQAGSEEGGKLIEEAKNKISQMIQELHGKIEKQMEEARDFLRKQSRNTSIEIAEKVLGRSIQ